RKRLPGSGAVCEVLIESFDDFRESLPEVLVEGLDYVRNSFAVDRFFAGVKPGPDGSAVLCVAEFDFHRYSGVDFRIIDFGEFGNSPCHDVIGPRTAALDVHRWIFAGGA